MRVVGRIWPQTNRVWQRFIQFDRMMERTGADPVTAVSERGGVSMAQARNACLRCLSHRECQSWLDRSEGPHNPPVFCPNATILCGWTLKSR